jgi:hypothetical protein
MNGNKGLVALGALIGAGLVVMAWSSIQRDSLQGIRAGRLGEGVGRA